MKKACIAFLLLFFTLSSANAAGPITIGLSLGLTGKYDELGDMQIKAFKLWEKDVNKRGGILGRNVHLIIYDDKSDARTARSLYEHLITKDNVDMVFGPYSSELTEAILPITEKYGYPLIASAGASDALFQKGHQYVFGVYTPASRYAVGFLEMLVKYNIETVALAYTKEAFSQSVAFGAKEWAEKFGIKVLLFSLVRKGTKDTNEFVKKAREANAQVVMVCGHFDEAVNTRLALRKIGWYPKAYYASVGPALQAFQRELGADADYAFTSSQWERHGKLPGSEEFYRAFLKAYGKAPSYHSAAAYASGQILEQAIKKAGSLDRKKVRNVLSTMEIMTVMGRHGVDRKTGRQVKQFSLIIQNQKGKKEIVWPEDLRTVKPIFR